MFVYHVWKSISPRRCRPLARTFARSNADRLFAAPSNIQPPPPRCRPICAPAEAVDRERRQFTLFSWTDDGDRRPLWQLGCRPVLMSDEARFRSSSGRNTRAPRLLDINFKPRVICRHKLLTGIVPRRQQRGAQLSRERRACHNRYRVRGTSSTTDMVHAP